MSLIVAVKDEQDAVVASDGRVLGEDLSVLSDDSLKTVALNADLCLGIAGHSKSMRQVLDSLGLRCRRAHPSDILSVCQELDCPVDVSYQDARHEISEVLRWMARRTAPSERAHRIPAVVLLGRWRETPRLCTWNDPTWTADEAGMRGFSAASVGVLPDEGSPALAAYQKLVAAPPTTDEAETRLARAVRLCADCFGDTGPVNGTVFVRRLSRGFELVHAP